MHRDVENAPLRLVLDRALLDASERSVDYLREFDSHPLVEVLVDSDELAMGTVVLGDPDVKADMVSVTRHTKSGTVLSAIWPYHQWIVIAGQEAGRRNEPFGPWQRDIVLARAAIAADADVLVTQSPRLLNQPIDAVARANPLTPDDAAAVLGLYLRHLEDYTIQTSPNGSYRMNRGLFYWVATRSALGASWRWFSACVNHSQASRDDTVMMLGQSALQRFTRCLQARDQVHIQMNMPQDNDRADEAMSALDALLVFLLGSFDASARVAHIACGSPKTSATPGWHKRTWVEEMAPLMSGIESLVGPETEGRHLMRLVAECRNSIHGAGLQTVTLRESWSAEDETVVQLPHAGYGQFLSAVDHLGGREQWGIRELLPDAAGLDPDSFVDSLIDQSAALLNRLMDVTPVENLGGVDPATSISEPPEDDVFGAEKRLRIMALLGLPYGSSSPAAI